MASAAGEGTAPRTKLVCTIGPASVRRVDELVAAGMDVARVNWSHGTPASRRDAVAAVRRAATAAGRAIGVLADLSGPKIRLGRLAEDAVALEAGRPFTLRPGDARPGDANGAGVSYRGLARDLRPGDHVFLADGAVELLVTEVADAVRTEVLRAGTVRSRQGVSVPSGRLSTPALTTKDRRDIPATLELGADLIAQSFVRGPDDVRTLREVLGPAGPPIVAKIETRAAVDAFDDILEVADAVMIARGDLGVEVPFEEVPILQKELVRQALDRGVPSIVATQMLESMTGAPRPTRAEASDVANAVFDGADAIMLSGETAIGRYPVLAAAAADRILRACDGPGAAHLPAGRTGLGSADGGPLAVAAVSLAAADPRIDAIVCSTRTGRTARSLAALRPRVPIVAITADARLAARLTLLHGVRPLVVDAPDGTSDRQALLDRLVDGPDAMPAGARVILIASTGPDAIGPDAIGPDVLELDRVRRT